MATVVLGVGAGIAAYKAALVLRDLQRAGHDVIVVPTPSSLAFVGKETWEGLTGRPVHTGVFEAGGADHVELARKADIVAVVPATADLMARIRAGMADDLLTTTILAATCPVVVFPAMHSGMWQNPATQDNVATLRERGVIVLDPDSGALGSGDSGIGRLPDPDLISAFIDSVVTNPDAPEPGAPALVNNENDLTGRTVIITAGGTHEPIDPVRFLGNSSSGRQGVELAREAADRGATVFLVASNVDAALLPDDPAIAITPAPTADEVSRKVQALLPGADALIMAAAIADFRPAHAVDDKIKKDPDSDDAPTIELVRNPDILATVAKSADRPAVLVGFGAETGPLEQVLARGRDKALRKGADLLAVNRVGEGLGFGDVDNELHVLDNAGDEVAVLTGSKRELSHGLLDLVAARLGTMAR